MAVDKTLGNVSARNTHDEKRMNVHSLKTIQFKEKLPGIRDMDLFSTTGWNTDYKFSAVDLEKAIANSWHAVSAYDSGTLVGFGRTIADGVHHALIVDVIVLPEYQGIGIGTAIVTGLLKKCKEEKIRDIQLFAAADRYEFYEKLGFRARPRNAPGMEYQAESSTELQRSE